MTIVRPGSRLRRFALLACLSTALGVVPLAIPSASADEGDIALPAAELPPLRPGTEPRNAGTPWVTPTRPEVCSSERADSGDVAGCLVDGPGGTNAERGFGTPPFPVPTNGEVLPWKTVRIGDSGPIVRTIQTALVQHGWTLSSDGEFGPMTQAAVKGFQRSVGLDKTGAVNAATADALGVERTTGGTFPPAGWNWSGWGYNGSPALRDWEQSMATSKAVPGFSAGRLRAHPAVIGLFEGFMTEMTALGYDVSEIGSYVFRCTSGTGKTCQGMTPSSLSNHAYGIAMDMNTAANPELYYEAQDGTSACAVPMRTDMPRALIRAAEKWGLYWGGYGWYGGCASPSEWKSSTHRDPMHFEFRGDVFIAQAIIAHNAGQPVPSRWCGDVLDIVNSVAAGIEHVCSTSSRPPSGAVIVVPVARADAVAAAVSVSAVGTSRGTVNVTSCRGAVRWRPLISVSTTRTSVGTVVPLTDGRLCISLPDGASVKMTRTGAWTSAASGGGLGLVPIAPPDRLTPRADGAVTFDGEGDAVWVSVRPATATRVSASRCSSPDSTGRPIRWIADVDLEELQLVPLTDVDGAHLWCLRSANVAVSHVARFVTRAGSGFRPGVRSVSDTSALPSGTTAVAVQVRSRSGSSTVSICTDATVVRSFTIPGSDQVSTVMLTVPTSARSDASLCVDPASGARIHLLGTFHPDSSARLVLSGPRQVASLRS